MGQDAEASLVVVWQAEFWRRNGETYWIDFPRHISEALEKGRKSGRSFVYRLKTGELEEKDEDLSSTAWKKDRREEGEVSDTFDASDAWFVYWIDTKAMRQINEHHGFSRRLRSVWILQEELKRIHQWP